MPLWRLLLQTPRLSRVDRSLHTTAKENKHFLKQFTAKSFPEGPHQHPARSFCRTVDSSEQRLTLLRSCFRLAFSRRCSAGRGAATAVVPTGAATAVGPIGTPAMVGSCGSSSQRGAFLARLRGSASPGVLLCLGHSASICGVIALCMEDMLFLRSFMVCGSLCGIAFNALQPVPLKVPAAWGCVFLLLNLTQIGFLLNERREVHFCEEEADAYKLVFEQHGVTSHQFMRLMKEGGGEWVDLPAGHVLLREGDSVDHVALILRGEGVVSVHGSRVGKVQRGSLVGEIAVLVAKDKTAGATVTVAEPTRAVLWKKDLLRKVLASDNSLVLSVSATINSDLATKLASQNHCKDRIYETYKEVLRGVCADGKVPPEEKRALREFRKQNQITQAQHWDALKEVGWTKEEFEDGAKWLPGQYSSIAALAHLLGQVVGTNRKEKDEDDEAAVPSPLPPVPAPQPALSAG